VTTRRSFTYYAGVYVPAEVMPDIKNVSFSIAAYVTCPAEDARGVIVSCGDRNLGFALYAQDGRPHFHYNAAGEHFTVSGTTSLPPGAATVECRFTKTGELRGVVDLIVNGERCGSGPIERTVGVTFVHQGISIGSSRGTSVTPAFEGPFPFSGAIDRVVFELGDDREIISLPADVHDWTARAEKF
jgi:arylsulfatase